MFKKYGLFLVLLPLFLAACDDAYIITRVDKKVSMSESRLVSMYGTDGIKAEIHGSPFPGLNARQIAAALTLPGGTAVDLNRFKAVEPGAWDIHNTDRLVLIFNGANHPDAVIDCKRQTESKTVEPSHTGFKVFAVFCSGQDWMGRGYLEAIKAPSDDPEEFSRLMRLLLRDILKYSDAERR